MGYSIIVLIFLAFAIFVDSSHGRTYTKAKYDPNNDRQWNPAVHVKSYEENGDSKSLPFKRTTRLYSKTSGKHVRIRQDGRVDGAGKEVSDLVKLSIQSATFGGKVRIRGVKSSLYLCMNRHGRLVGRKGKQPREKRKKCMFKEIQSNGYFRYRSVKYPGWYIAFNRRGKALRGPIDVKRKKWKNRLLFKRSYQKRNDKGRKAARRTRRMKKQRQLARKSKRQS